MYSINIKGKVTSKDKKLVKQEMIFFQTGYNRVSKVLNITGPIKDWDNASQSFISKSSDAIKKNKMLLDLKLKYQKIAEEWEEEGRKWSPAELALSLDNLNSATHIVINKFKILSNNILPSILPCQKIHLT